MMRIVLLLSLVALGSSHRIAKRSTNCACGWTPPAEQTRIVGGVEAKVNEFPFAAALLWKNGGQFCGGTIISEYHIITAAHCTYGTNPEDIVVSVGDHDWNREDETHATVTMKVAKIINHEKYTAKAGSPNDVSILVLESPIQMNVYVGPVCLPPKDLNTDNVQVTAAGWGMNSFDPKTNPGYTTLQKINLTTIPFEECKNKWSLDPENSQICLLHQGSGVFKGDSGGTIVYKDPEVDAYLLVGVTSYGSGYNAGEYPSVVGRVSYFLDWIETNVKSTVPEAETCSPY